MSEEQIKQRLIVVRTVQLMRETEENAKQMTGCGSQSFQYFDMKSRIHPDCLFYENNLIFATSDWQAT